jgi:site-specific recombinase XerD
VRGYTTDLRLFLKFLATQFPTVDLRAVTEADIEDWLASDPKAVSATKRRRLAAVSSFGRWAVRHKFMDRNPAADIPRPKADPPDAKWVPPEEVEALLDVTRGPLERAVFWVLALGLRRFEVAGLRVSDVNWANGILTVRGKGKSKRELPLTPPVREAFEQYLPTRGDTGSDRLFLQHKGRYRGRPLSGKCVPTMLRAWCRRARLADRGYTPHALRHGFATALDMSGVPLGGIQYLMGHRSSVTTARYIHADAEAAREAVARLHSKRMAGNGAADVAHAEAEVNAGCIQARVPKQALKGRKVAAAGQKQRGSRVAKAVEPDPGPVDPGTAQGAMQEPDDRFMREWGFSI